MKVLQLIQQPQLRGAEIFACQLSGELQNLGIPTDVACLFDSGSGLEDRFPQLTFNRVGGSRGRRMFDYAGLRRLHEIIVKGPYDLVQANAGDTLKYAAASKTLFGWKAKLIFRNANKLSDFIRNPLHAAINRWMIGRCDYVISVSEYCRQDIVRFQPAVEWKSTTISIGTYINPSLSIVSDQDAPVFINIGSFVPEKNQLFLLHVFESFVKKHGKGQLKFVGDGRLRGSIEAECHRLGLGDRVEFLGYRADPWQHLPKSSALVMPSIIEGLPAVILESMAARVPVIASDVGGIPELVRNDETGYCISGYDADKYVEAMEQVLSNDPQNTRIVARAYDKICRDYLMPAVAARFKKLYEKIDEGASS